MKILIIDDNQENLEAAKKQLADHEVTTLSSFDELASRFGYINSLNVKKLEDYFLSFEVILTDLFLPASLKGVKQGSYEDVPYGIIITMVALRLGIPVAIVTSAGHHDNPFTWALNLIGCDNEGYRSYLIGNNPFRLEKSGEAKEWDTALKYLLEVKIK